MTRAHNEQHGARGRKGLSFTAIVVAATVTFLLATNVALGFVLIGQSAATTKSLVNEKMLDVSNTAAGMLDGDELAALTAGDKDSDAYQHTLHTLRVFLDNIDLQYIYAIRQVGEDSFVFTIDPEPVSPGQFGDPVVMTKALKKAANGTPAVDEDPYEDQWGRFYSAYSPVFNSRGEVSGIVAVDFSAQWYEEQVFNHVRTAIIMGVLSLGIGALVVVVVTSSLRRRFRFLYGEISDLADDLEELTREVASPAHPPHTTAFPEDADAPERQPRNVPSDDIDALSSKVHEIQDELHWHIQCVREQAYTDVMTGVSSKTVYVEEIERLAVSIQKGDVRFSVAIFDLNGLKQVNDTFGHEQGDKVIIDTAATICQVFERQHVYRIGGDEFIVVMEDSTAEDMVARFAEFDARIDELNRQEDHRDLPLSVSKGSATFDPATDEDFHSVFRRADEAMYREKTAYYREHGENPRHYGL